LLRTRKNSIAGQTLVEYSFLISLSAMMSSIASFFQENLFAVFILAALLIVLLFRKPKFFLVVILIFLLLTGVLYLISILS
jgi:hypothetical protein